MAWFLPFSQAPARGLIRFSGRSCIESNTPAPFSNDSHEHDREGRDLQSRRSRAYRDRGFSRWGPRIQTKSRERGAVPILRRIRGQFRHHRILMDIQTMRGKIMRVADAMFREPLLPNFSPANLDAHSARVSALDQLDRALQSHIHRRRDEKMNMVRHDDKGMQRESPLPAIAVE